MDEAERAIGDLASLIDALPGLETRWHECQDRLRWLVETLTPHLRAQNPEAYEDLASKEPLWRKEEAEASQKYADAQSTLEQAIDDLAQSSALSPDAVLQVVDRLEQYNRRGADFAAKVAARPMRNAEECRRLANLYAQRNLAELAIQVLTQGTRQFNDAKIKSQLMLLMEHAGRVDDMLALTGKEMQRSPGDSSLRAQYESLLEQNGRFVALADLLEEDLHATPDDASLKQRYFRALQKAGRNADLVTFLQKELEAAPDDASIARHLAIALTAAGKQDELIAFLRQQAKAHPYDVSWRTQLQATLERAGRLDELIEEVVEELHAGRGDGKVEERLADLLDRAGRTDDLLAFLRMEVKANPTHSGWRARLEALLEKAGRLDELIDMVRVDVRDAPDNPKLHERLTVLLEHAGKNDELVKSLWQEIAQAPAALEPKQKLLEKLLALGWDEQASEFIKHELSEAGSDSAVFLAFVRMLSAPARQQMAQQMAIDYLAPRSDRAELAGAAARIWREQGEVAASIGLMDTLVARFASDEMLGDGLRAFLVESLADGDDVVRRETAAALERRPADPRVGRDLAEMIGRTGDSSVLWRVLPEAGWLDDAYALPLLHLALADQAVDLRKWAVEILCKRRGKRAAAELTACLRTETDPDMRKAITDALRQIDPRPRQWWEEAMGRRRWAAPVPGRMPLVAVLVPVAVLLLAGVVWRSGVPLSALSGQVHGLLPGTTPFASKVTPTPSLQIATVTADLANLRAGPSTGDDIVGRVNKDTTLTVLGRNQAADWLQVSGLDDTPAWIAADLVYLKVAVTSLPMRQ